MAYSSVPSISESQYGEHALTKGAERGRINRVMVKIIRRVFVAHSQGFMKWAHRLYKIGIPIGTAGDGTNRTNRLACTGDAHGPAYGKRQKGETILEILKRPDAPVRIRAAVFDFDGTISTLRCGWEEVMEPMMAEVLTACGRDTQEELRRLVRAYIHESTGIQTIFQMKWLAEQVRARGGSALDPWDYKSEYNRRLMQRVNIKKRALALGLAQSEEYLIAGAEAFLRALRSAGVRIYVASGTDHPDVVAEAKALGIHPLLDELMGAPTHEENCSKERVLQTLMNTHHLAGNQVAVIGDGKVEIRLGNQMGALTVGLASDERKRSGVNPVKRERLVKAGAYVIVGDFLEKERLLSCMGI